MISCLQSVKLTSFRFERMTAITRLLLGFLLLGLADSRAADKSLAQWAQPGAFEVAITNCDWNDTARTRAVPAKIYYPKFGLGPFPLIIFSHGLGGTKDGYEFLGRQWASHGYISVHLQHLGSDDGVWKNATQPSLAMRQAANFKNAVDRPQDVKFAIDQMLKINAGDGPLGQRIDTNRIGMAGHSFGAYTTLAAAGQTFGPQETSFADGRIRAAIAMSAPVPRNPPVNHYRQIAIPILHMTGTEDNSPIGDTAAAERRVPFDRIPATNQFFVNFIGGDHMIFSDRPPLLVNSERNKNFRKLILLSSTAFWDAFLKDNADAKIFLKQDGLEKQLGASARYEKK